MFTLQDCFPKVMQVSLLRTDCRSQRFRSSWSRRRDAAFTTYSRPVYSEPWLRQCRWFCETRLKDRVTTRDGANSWTTLCYQVLRLIWQKLYRYHSIDPASLEPTFNARSGRTSASHTEENVNHMRDFVKSDHRMSVKMTALTLNHQIGIVQTIMTKDSTFKRCRPGWFPKYSLTNKSSIEWLSEHTQIKIN